MARCVCRLGVRRWLAGFGNKNVVRACGLPIFLSAVLKLRPLVEVLAHGIPFEPLLLFLRPYEQRLYGGGRL